MKSLRKLVQGFNGGNPHRFVHGILKDADIAEVLRLKEYLNGEAENHAGQLKQFVKENFESCIRSKDTILEVADRLRAAEAEAGVGAHGATPAKVQEELNCADLAAQKVFSDVIKRYEVSQNLENVLLLLGKYDSLVLLPSMVRAAVESRDFETVVLLYSRAVKLVTLESQGAGEVQTIWQRLKFEVHRVCNKFCKWYVNMLAM